MLIKQFGLAGSLDHISKGAGTAMLCSNFGQPKAECDPTPKYTHCVYPIFMWFVYPFLVI